MGSYPWWKRALSWLAFSPVLLAYRLIWLTARLGNRDARCVLEAMRTSAWLAVPSLTPTERRK